MAKKLFALRLKDGVEVKTLDDLRNNFDLEKIVSYFKSGELVEWLEDRFYEDEVESLEDLSANDDNLSQKICAALGLEGDGDLEFNQRVKEKRGILADMTDDQNIIDNAAITALNQDDLATLLHMEYKTIYLCGENFNVPIRITDTKYIGILSTPKIKIRANSDEDLAAKNIVIENCQTTWRKVTPIDELKALAAKIFGDDGKWLIISDLNAKMVEGNAETFDDLKEVEKAMAVRAVCQGKYSEKQVVYMQIASDFSDGFALTTDSFCTCGVSSGFIIKYKNIRGVDSNSMRYLDEDGRSVSYYVSQGILYNNSCETFRKVKKFLDVVKNF